MKSMLALAWRSLVARRFVALLTVACIALGSAVLIIVEQLRAGARDGFTRSISGVDLVVGPRSGSIELLMGVVFRTGTPGPGMAHATYRDIAALPGVAWALPVSFGDSHRGFPVMGTDVAYFQKYRFGRSQPLVLAAGQPFADVYDAVVGADVAQRLGYKVGDEIELEHGLHRALGAGQDHADKPFRVVGVFQRTGTAVDRTVHVSLEGIEAMHLDWKQGRPPSADERIDADVARQLASAPDRVSAVLLGLEQRSAALLVQQRIVNWPSEPLSAVLPGAALLELWEIVGAAENVLRGMSWGAMGVVLIGMVTVLWSGLEERRREMAVLRAVGARPRHVFLLILGEAFLITVFGLVLGASLSIAAVGSLQGALIERYGLTVASPLEAASAAAMLAALLAAGVAAGVLPAWRCYRRSLSDGLNPDAGA